MSLLSLCALLFQQSHLFLICVVLTRNDSRIIPRKTCQILRNCLCIQLLAFLTVPETFSNSSPSPEKILFHTGMILSIEWLDLVPRLRIGDCFEIHLPRWGLCDLLLSSHQKILLEVLLRQCVFCKEPLLSWFGSRHRNVGLLGSEF